jgi:hypothetical protein
MHFIREHDDTQEEARYERDTKRTCVRWLEGERHPCPKREQYWRDNLQRNLDKTVPGPGLRQRAKDTDSESAEDNDGTNERQLHVGKECPKPIQKRWYRYWRWWYWHWWYWRWWYWRWWFWRWWYWRW